MAKNFGASAIQSVLNHAAQVARTPRPPFSYEKIKDRHQRGGFHYRIRDAQDDRIATTYDEAHATMIVELLNKGVAVS